MASNAEERVSRSLRAVLADFPIGADIPESESFQVALTDLEWFIPELLVDVYPEWQREALDGIVPVFARKTAERELELFGVCILITDQTVTPLHLHVLLSDAVDEVAWLECRVGEQGKDGMMRTPYDSMRLVTKRLLKLGSPDRVEPSVARWGGWKIEMLSEAQARRFYAFLERECADHPEAGFMMNQLARRFGGTA